MFPYKVYQSLRVEQRELAVRIGRLEQFIDNYDDKGMNIFDDHDDKGTSEEQRELAVRIGRLKQFIDNYDDKGMNIFDDHDNKGMNKELDDDYMSLLRDQLESMKHYNVCLVQRIGLAVTEGIAPQERSRGNQAIRRDVKKFRESCEIDPRDPAKQDSDKVVADEDEHNFGFYCGFDTSIL